MLFFTRNFGRRGTVGGRVGSFCFPLRISVFHRSMTFSMSAAIVLRSPAFFFFTAGLEESESSLTSLDEALIAEANAVVGASVLAATFLFCFFFSASDALDSITFCMVWRIRHPTGAIKGGVRLLVKGSRRLVSLGGWTELGPLLLSASKEWCWIEELRLAALLNQQDQVG
uniref:Uncharacterized protein n=1 Tax=Setaria viridis TaxID=4556 RepID=A0A4U6UYI4_SETVI|nr:hypothetical protein SEVIR_4G087901v2 [Setaria viridis]